MSYLKYRTLAILTLFLIIVAQPSCALAEDGTESTSASKNLAQRHVAAFERVTLATARYEALTRVQNRLQVATRAQNPTPGAGAPLLQLVGHEMFAGELENPVVGHADQLFAAVDASHSQLQYDLETARARWIELRTAALMLEEQLHDVAGSGNLTADLATLLNARNKWLWLAGCLSACGIILTYSYVRRHARRRLFWVRRNRYIFAGLFVVAVLAILAIPAALLFVTGNSLFETVAVATGNERPLAVAEREIEELTNDSRLAAIEPQIAECEQKAEAIVNTLSSELGDVMSNGDPLVSRWTQFLHRVVDAQSSRHLLQELKKRIQEERNEINSHQAKLDSNIGEIRNNRQRKHWVAAGMGLVILAVFGSAGLSLVRKESVESKERRTTCPQCQTKNSLKLEGNNLVCEAEFDDGLQTIPCEFSYSQIYGELPKLVFPTLGIAASGKTHWMAANYGKLNFGNAPEGVTFQRLKSNKTAEFDRLIEGLLQNRAGFGATEHGQNPIVHPLMFVLGDKDPIPFSASQVIASLLDLGGIVTQQSDHPLRQSALNGQGFLFFIDPTRPTAEQNNVLTMFRDDVQAEKQLKPQQQIQRPLAICLSKIDMIGTGASVGPMPAVAQEFYRALAEADNAYPALSIQLIQARHEIVDSYVETLFPGWALLSSLKSLFGPRVCFFPLTPVGFQGADLGAEPSDFSRRPQDPYAILEPLLWLIHMNGYPILK
jgi:hypothetical protein